MMQENLNPANSFGLPLKLEFSGRIIQIIDADLLVIKIDDYDKEIIVNLGIGLNNKEEAKTEVSAICLWAEVKLIVEEIMTPEYVRGKVMRQTDGLDVGAELVAHFGL